MLVAPRPVFTNTVNGFMNNNAFSHIPLDHHCIRAQVQRWGILRPLCPKTNMVLMGYPETPRDHVTELPVARRSPLSNTGGKSSALSGTPNPKRAKSNKSKMDTLTFTVFEAAAFRSPAFTPGHKPMDVAGITDGELHRFMGWLFCNTGLALRVDSVIGKAHNGFLFSLPLVDAADAVCGRISWGGGKVSGEQCPSASRGVVARC